MPSVEILQPQATGKNGSSAQARFGDALAIILLAAGLLLRLFNAAYRFLNADEVLHYLLSLEPSFRATYRASLTTVHPPFLIIFLHYWGAIVHSEFFLRLPLVLAGTAFCWAMYAWLKLVTDAEAALIGLILFLFSPALIIVSAEIRQYDPLLLFAALSLYFLERALQRDSIWSMLLSAFSLYLALLSHYSSLIFALTLGGYALLRLTTTPQRPRRVITWAAGQTGALALIGFLFTHHLPLMRARGAWEGIADTYLKRSVFQPDQERALGFIARSNIRLFHYLFSQAAVGVLAFVLFIAGIVLLFRNRARLSENRWPADWQLGLLFVFPLFLNCILGLFRLYPYGGTRHNSYLAIFVFPGIAIALSRWKANNRWVKPIAIAVALAICNLFPSPEGEYIRARDQSRAAMTQAVTTLNSLPENSIIFTDDQGGLLLSYYLCDSKAVQIEQRPFQPLFKAPCGRYSVISLDPRRWTFKPNTFPETLASLQQTFDLSSGTAVWFFQAGWFIDKEFSLHDELKQFGCSVPETFGHNIFICQIQLP